jgi:hypothetical protein
MKKRKNAQSWVFRVVRCKKEEGNKKRKGEGIVEERMKEGKAQAF